jgi:hypothetical protein
MPADCTDHCLYAALREQSRQAAQAAAASLHDQQQEQERKALLANLESLHHLLSTSAQAGVLKTPAQVASGTVPSVGDVAVEEVIRLHNHGQVRIPAPHCCQTAGFLC